MRKVSLALILALCLVLSFAFSASAHPYASGGGCGGTRTSAYRDISGYACISWQSPNAMSKGVVSFSPLGGHGGVYSCSLNVSIEKDVNGSLRWIAGSNYSCTTDAQAGHKGVTYGPFPYYINSSNAGSYLSNMSVDINYVDGFVTNLVSYNSPLLNAP